MIGDWITAILASGLGAAASPSREMTEAEREAFQRQLQLGMMQQTDQQWAAQQQAQLAGLGGMLGQGASSPYGDAAYNQALAQQLMAAPSLGAGQQLLGSMLGSPAPPLQRDSALEQQFLDLLARAPRERPAAPAPKERSPVHLTTVTTTTRRRVKLKSKERR